MMTTKTKMDNYLDFFPTEQKAIDYAVWLNFKYRLASIKFGVIHGPEDNWAVLEEATAKEMEKTFLDNLPKDYALLPYSDIETITTDDTPHVHWEMIKGIFSNIDGEVLRFILHHKVPLERFVRYQLASRGHDENHRWCGFKKACEIWLTEDS